MIDETIFVMIASYKDLEITPTLFDLFGKAKYPENIRVSICWQGDFSDVRHLDDWPNVRVIYVNPKESKGLGFARSIAQTHYDGETYCLQLDSHHRFAQDWDVWHINQIKSLQSKGYEKPLLTAYAGSYSSVNNQLFDQSPFKITLHHEFNGFRHGGWTIPFIPEYLPNNLPEPVKARFCSGHYVFTVGRYADEFRFDPYCYFWGEELTMSVRAFTLGYDLFHPHQLQVWHRYVWSGTNGNVGSGGDVVEKHYEVFPDKFRRENHWMGRLRSMTNQGNPEEHKFIPESLALGNVRTLKEYEEYAGIDFKNRVVEKNWSK